MIDITKIQENINDWYNYLESLNEETQARIDKIDDLMRENNRLYYEILDELHDRVDEIANLEDYLSIIFDYCTEVGDEYREVGYVNENYRPLFENNGCELNNSTEFKEDFLVRRLKPIEKI